MSDGNYTVIAGFNRSIIAPCVRRQWNYTVTIAIKQWISYQLNDLMRTKLLVKVGICSWVPTLTIIYQCRWPFFWWRRAWRYQRGNQNPYIEEEQTTQWPKEKVRKDKLRSTKHTYKTKDRVTRIPLITGGELRCSGRVGASCSTSDTRLVNLVCFTSGSYWSFLCSK